MTRFAVPFGLVLSAAASAAPLRYAEDRAPAIVNPIFATTMAEARLNELVFESLFTDDHELRSQPELAESFLLAADRRSMTIDLRRDVMWHDGAAFTAADVVFTVQAMKDAGTASTEAGRVAWIKGLSAEGPSRLKIDFQSEEWAPEEKLHFKILPKHKFSSTFIKRTDPFRTQPIGTGAFKVASFNGDNSVSLARYDRWHGECTLAEVTMREVADTNYQAKLLTYESLEALVRVLPRDVAALKADRRVELYPYQTNSWWYVGFNLQQARFQDLLVRQAIHRMIDAQALLEPVGTGDLLTGPFVPSSPFYNHEIPVLTADLNAARMLLESAGYTQVGRQWTGKDGQPLKIRLTAPEGSDVAQDVVINLQSQLQLAGLSVEPEFLGSAEWKQRVWRDRDFDLIVSQWSFDRNEDIYEQFHSKGTRNFVAYTNPEVDALLDQARTTADPQQKRAILRQVHAKVANEDPMVFLWTLDSYSALSTKVKNVVIHPFYFFTWAHEWSLTP